MKRLKSKLLGLEPIDNTYKTMYEGSMAVDGEIVYDSTYYRENTGFLIERTHKLAQDKPTITVMIPADVIFNTTEGEDLLKRLKHYLLGMEPNTAVYKEMYEGEMVANLPPKSNGDLLEPETHKDSTYWREDIGYSIDRTHKLALDKPSVTIQIPVDSIGAGDYTKTAADYCLRAFKPYINKLNDENYNRSRPDKENGKYYLYAPGGEVLVRNTAYFKLVNQKYYVNGGGSTVYVLPDGEAGPPKMCLCITMQVQLPAKKIRKTIQMLTKDLPDAVEEFILGFDTRKLNAALVLAEKQVSIREWLRGNDYCVFIANGSILPRSKGTDLPLPGAVPFKSTPDDEIEINGIRGMGIRRGVTVITGGGYSGKSTLLDAISAGIYDHIEGDGRELVITDGSAQKISAEDGRSVKNVNISPFIKWLPNGDTRNFSTEHASGSTSQAANIMESVNSHSILLLIDEDKSATNFMIRDNMMKQLIEKEPITPLTDRVNELYENNGVSTILVIGGSGEYLPVADKIYMMQDYIIADVTEKAKNICKKIFSAEKPDKVIWKHNRILLSDGFSSYPEGSGTERLEVSDMGFIFTETRGLISVCCTIL
ncbi:MAG: P-loop domain-containing protein [Eubacteriales bacterium]